MGNLDILVCMSDEKLEYHIRFNEELRAYELLMWTGCAKFEVPNIVKRWTKKEFNKLMELLII